MQLLRKLLAPKEQVWKPYCDDIGGRYVEGRWLQGDRVEITHHGRMIVLVTESEPETGHRSTLLRAEVDLVDGVMLGLLRNWPGQKVINLMVSMFGLQRTTVSGVSNDCMILAKDQSQAEAFFGDTGLQDLILKHPQLTVFVGVPPGLSQRGRAKQVRISVPQVVQDLSQLKSLVELSRVVINVLSDRGLIAPQGDAS